jgi:hypothetical protein
MGQTDELVTHAGGCHCGRVRFQVRSPARIEVLDCNCSICAMTGFLHLIVPAAQFQLLRGADMLACYQFNTGAARHLFCRVCGIKSYYVPRSHPDGFSVNARCLDAGTVTGMRVLACNGRDWEQQFPGGRGAYGPAAAAGISGPEGDEHVGPVAGVGP